MTKEILNKAIVLDSEIDVLQGKKEELEYARKLCHGNTSEVNARSYRIKICKGMNELITVNISSPSAMDALNKELGYVGKAIVEAEAAFAALKG